MTSFFGELGKRLAEKWLSLLLLPSLLLAAVVGVAVALGHASALDGALLAGTAEAWFRAVGALPVASQVLLLGVLLLACSGAGLLVRALAGGVARVWLGSWGHRVSRLGDLLVARRRARWDAADAASAAPDPADPRLRLRAALRRNAIAPARPTRPTWMGDQLAAAEARLHHQHGADLESWWPRLWLVVDDSTRSELRAARALFDAAAVQAGWALAYLATALLWWPAVLIAAGVGVSAWLRGRAAVRVHAALLESVVDVHRSTLARRLDLLPEGQTFDRETGLRVTDLCRKGA
ncbi:hypothetical protein [Pseudonocardia kunmingensis]|uniref:Uncharacterized protein n=1 Tax=Pseudonocardia kunmingensis TaxID=630975 RepID=A0A543DN79_9PSEU|nr:hypothetical protein [Pseudonocardia kunmingensis]TQM10796.1 hypothetical protein FB558_3317 [Pseudonocardia kunmingensis]